MRAEKNSFSFYILHCNSGISGQVIAGIIVDSLRFCILDGQFIRGQGYDRAGNMSLRKVLQLEFKKDFLCIVYTVTFMTLLNPMCCKRL